MQLHKYYYMYVTILWMICNPTTTICHNIVETSVTNAAKE